MPTAELELYDAKAWLLSPVNIDVKAIAPVLNISRVHSAVHSVGVFKDVLPLPVRTQMSDELKVERRCSDTFRSMSLR